MLIGIPVEARPGERRVALAPDTVRTLVGKGHEFVVEAGAGTQAGFPDTLYTEAGATISDASTAWSADVVATVAAPDDAASRMKSGAALVGFLQPLERPESIEALAEAGITSMAFEMLPRTTLAQAMDALSSQANLAGYQAVLLGADKLGQILPMMTTACHQPEKAIR